jgi:nucleotide-binding universal stress UspA family protein
LICREYRQIADWSGYNREDTFQMLPNIKTILYASDIRHGSRPAFRMAVRQSVQNQARIVFLHIIEPVSVEAEEMIRDYLPKDVRNLHIDQLLQEHRARIEIRIQQFLDDELDGVELPFAPVIQVDIGNPGTAILAAAEKTAADLIVMGDRASNALSRLFLGSTAQSVIHRSPVPVLIVPLPKPQQEI